jgi:parallel beta-helix repeat protein
MKLVLSIMMIIILSWGSPVCGQTTDLNEGNAKGSAGYQYWDIQAPGTYRLNFSGTEFTTNHQYAIRIFVSNVTLDGNGKTITGPGIGTIVDGPSFYGVRVNGGGEIVPQNVTVQNVIVEKKGVGVIYEDVQGGTITSSQFHSNTTGICAWKSSNLNILSNTVYSNTNGIVLDANETTNDHITIGSNNVYGNSAYGIFLWLGNNYNVISNNQVHDNPGIAGISLSDGLNTDGTPAPGGANNTISGNAVNGNTNGIFLSNCSDNQINGNSLSGNSNAAVFLQYSSNRNIITNNQVNDNLDTGIALTDERSGGAGGTGNTLSNNTVGRNANGIVLRNYHGNAITGNSLTDNRNIGVLLMESSSGNLFTGNYVLSSEDIGWLGVRLETASHGNIFYNNVFKNSHPLYNPDENYGSDWTVYNNQWYTTPTPGVNIVGGPTIGGNYWGNLHVPPTGFSDTCLDSNNDGFCDQPYSPPGFSSELIDQYPLHKVAVFNVTPGGLDFGTVPVGSTKDLTLTVKNTGAGTLTGNATTATPFSVFSGGSYSLVPDQSQDVTIRYQPTSAGPHTGAVAFTGGGGATVPVTGKTAGPRGLPWLILLLGN